MGSLFHIRNYIIYYKPTPVVRLEGQPVTTSLSRDDRGAILNKTKKWHVRPSLQAFFYLKNLVSRRKHAIKVIFVL